MILSARSHALRPGRPPSTGGEPLASSLPGSGPSSACLSFGLLPLAPHPCGRRPHRAAFLNRPPGWPVRGVPPLRPPRAEAFSLPPCAASSSFLFGGGGGPPSCRRGSTSLRAPHVDPVLGRDTRMQPRQPGEPRQERQPRQQRQQPCNNPANRPPGGHAKAGLVPAPRPFRRPEAIAASQQQTPQCRRPLLPGKDQPRPYRADALALGRAAPSALTRPACLASSRASAGPRPADASLRGREAPRRGFARGPHGFLTARKTD